MEMNPRRLINKGKHVRKFGRIRELCWALPSQRYLQALSSCTMHGLPRYAWSRVLHWLEKHGVMAARSGFVASSKRHFHGLARFRVKRSARFRILTPAQGVRHGLLLLGALLHPLMIICSGHTLPDWSTKSNASD